MFPNNIGILTPSGINNSLKHIGSTTIVIPALLATPFLASFFNYSRYFKKYAMNQASYELRLLEIFQYKYD